MDLKLRFIELLKNYTENQSVISDLWKSIETKYTEKHRTYHNLKHLEELFSYFDDYKTHLEQPDLVAFSIFYHDIIYNIWKKDNEEKSADFALEVLNTLLPELSLEIIKEQIVATKTHESEHLDTQYLIDFDLAVLGQSSEVYQQYSKLIRTEYKLVPSLLYKQGRKKVLQHFIDKPFIYKTNSFIEKFEEQAKTNLQNELNNI